MSYYDHTNQYAILEALKMLKPWSMKKNYKIRLGNDYDGGYVVPSLLKDVDLVVSIGVGSDVSFDLALAHQGAKIYQFDHTVQGVPNHQIHENFNFYKKGWGSVTDGDLISLSDIEDLIGDRFHTAKSKILKFDIEGAEYEIFASLDPKLLSKYDVIVLELHYLNQLGNKDFLAIFNNLLNRISIFHKVVHLHANNWRNPVLIEGVVIPEVVEITLLRSDLDLFLTYSSDPIPCALDAPCRKDVPDLILNLF